MATVTRLTQQQETGLLAHRTNSTQQSSVLGRLWTVYENTMADGPDFLKSMCKLTSATTFWAKFFYPEAPQGVSNIGALAKNTKNAIGVIGLPLVISKLWNSIVSFKFSDPVKSTLDVAGNACSMVNNGCDTIELGHTVVAPLPHEVMHGVKVASYTATFLGSVKSSIDTVFKLIENSADYTKQGISTVTQGKISQKMISNSMGLISTISYVALGALGLASLLTPIAPAAIVACLTVGTVVGLGKFFYDRVVDPTGDRAKSVMNNPHFASAVEMRIGALRPKA